MKQGLVWLIVAIFAGTVVAGTEDFNDGGLNGWSGWGGGDDFVQIIPDGGVDNSPYLRAGVNAKNQALPWVGDFRQRSIIFFSVSLKAIDGVVVNPAVAIRYSSSTNRWRYVFTSVLEDDGLWHDFLVQFDPNWSDAVAIANGWIKEDVGGFTFVEFLEHVSEFDVMGTSPGSSSMGIDNVGIYSDPWSLSYDLWPEESVLWLLQDFPPFNYY